MATMTRVKARWSGFNGAPGWTNFFFREFSSAEPTVAEANLAAGRVHAFFQNVAPALPPSVTVQVQNDVELIEETNGQLQNVHSVDPRAVIAGTNATTTYSGPTGMVVTWRTGSIKNGRRVRGRTFLVPCSNGIYESNGTINSDILTTVQNAANALLTEPASPDLGIWTRPSSPAATDGAWFDVSGATIPDMASILRSRRD